MAIKQTEYIKFGENLYEIIPPLPSGTDRGGIIASPKQSTDTVEVKLGDDGKLYVPTYPDLTNADTSELQAQIDEIANSKAEKEHSHEISDVTNLQTKLDEINSGIGQKANISDLTSHTTDTTVHITEVDRTKLIEAYEHSKLAHASNDAEKNIIIGVIVNGEELSIDENRKINISTHTLLTQGTSVILGDDFLLEEPTASVTCDNEGNVLMRCSSVPGISVTDDGNGNVRLTI